MATKLRVPGYAPSGGQPAYKYADYAGAAAGAMNGAPLPDGSDPATWAATNFVYTGTSMKPSTGSFGAAAINTGTLTGRVDGIVGALPGSSPFLGVICRYADSQNYIRLALVPGTGKLVLRRYIANVPTDMFTDAGAAVAVGDKLSIIIDGAGIHALHNDTEIYANAAGATLSNAALQTPTWGLMGAFATDAVGAFSKFGFNPAS